MMPGMASRKYAALIAWSKTVSMLAPDSILECLAPAAGAFRTNLVRMAGMSLMPAVVAAHALREGRGDTGEVPRGALAEGVAVVERNAEIAAVVEGLKGLLSSVIIGTWTAFE